MNLVLTKNLNLFKDKKNKHIKHNIFNSVASSLQNSDLLIRKLSVGIIVNCLLLNNFDSFRFQNI